MKFSGGERKKMETAKKYRVTYNDGDFYDAELFVSQVKNLRDLPAVKSVKEMT